MNTPSITGAIPFSYTLLLHWTAYLYCLLLPFGLVDSMGSMTPFVVAIVTYTFFGLESNDLPLDTICRTLEINLRESLCDPNPRPPLVPVNFSLP